VGKINKTILIIDDEEDILKIASYYLKKAGYKVITATNGNSAFEIFTYTIPDLILLDYQLPGMNGAEVLRLIRLEEPLKDIPIIFLTASSDIGKNEFLKKENAQDMLIKPFEKDALIEIIAHHIS
jgi:CheY-like chemotaxis protein